MVKQNSGLGLLISDDEIRASHGEAVLSELDADPATRAYQPYYNGMRYRPAVMAALEHRNKVAS